MDFKMDSLDSFLCNLPLVGRVIKRLYSYFKKHTGIADALHVALGLGIGLVFARQYALAGIFLGIGLGGHIYAFIKGGN